LNTSCGYYMKWYLVLPGVSLQLRWWLIKCGI